MFVLLFLVGKSYANWQGPYLDVKGPWGDSPGEFGFASGNPEDGFPREFFVDNNVNLLILDIFNKRVQIFSDGKYSSSIYAKSLNIDWDPQIWPSKKTGIVGGNFVEAGFGKVQIYNYEGDVVSEFRVESGRYRGVANSNSIVMYNKGIKKYQVFSQTGDLLTVYDEKPLELGVIKSYRGLSGVGGEGVEYTIAYEDVEFTITTPIDIDRNSFVRDQAGILYVTGQPETPNSDWPWRYRVFKFDACGKLLATLDLPETKTEVVDLGAPLIVGETRTTFLEEYGPPVIGPDGSVYCWKRTPDNYSILKWTWVDSPDDPQPGPDAPSNLTVQPSIDGLYLTWGASPQDPGCVDGYEVERSTSAGGIYTSVKTTDPGVLKFNDTGALPGTTYFYKVRAKGGGEFSPHTAEVSGSRIQ